MKAVPFILYRYLLLSWASQKKYRQGSAISILIPIFGVAVGVFAFIVVVSVMSGFVQNIKHSMLQFEPHIIISNKIVGEPLQSNDGFLTQLKKNHPNIIAVSSFQKSDVILQANHKAVIANLFGLDTSKPDDTFHIEKYLNIGTHLKDLNDEKPSSYIDNSALFPTVVLGRDLMNQLDLRVGDTVTLVSPSFDDGFGGVSPIQMPVVIIGYLNSGHFAFDKKMVLTSLLTSNLFLREKDSIYGYQLTLNDAMNAPNISSVLNKEFSKSKLNIYHATPWTENNRSFLKALALEHYGMVFVLIMIILVGCFSISISLLLSIRRKSKEMAILRSMGFQQIELSYLYLWQGFLLGLVGIVLGLSFGFATLYIVHHYSIPFITSSYSSEPLPVVVNLTDVLIVVFGSLFLSMFAAVWPAYEVKNLNVIDILSIRN